MERLNVNVTLSEKPTRKEIDVEFIPTGSTLLDLALNGGWALGRIFNIVGDKSSGKTLLVIEAFANFSRLYPSGRMRYAEAESAFDEAYAEVLGFPDTVERPKEPLETVEDFERDVYRFLKDGGPSLYILDSLDALTDEAEQKKFIKSMKPKKAESDEGNDEKDEKEKGSYGVAKAKKMSEFFRMLTQDVKKADCSLGIVSQIRDRLNVSFGETKTRSGGRALDFYASQILWLAELKKINHSVMGIPRTTGINVQGKVKKNKVGLPFREVKFDIVFNYGIDDENSMLDWLSQLSTFSKDDEKAFRSEVRVCRDGQNFDRLQEINLMLADKTRSAWNEIEAALAPSIRKYR